MKNDEQRISREPLARLLAEIKGHIGDEEAAAYCAGIVSGADRERIRAHLAGCSSCTDMISGLCAAQDFWNSTEGRARARKQRDAALVKLGLARPTLGEQLLAWLKAVGLVGEGLVLTPSLLTPARAQGEELWHLAQGQTDDARLQWTIDLDSERPGGIEVHLVTTDRQLAGLALVVQVGNWTSDRITLEADERFPGQWGADVRVPPNACATDSQAAAVQQVIVLFDQQAS